MLFLCSQNLTTQSHECVSSERLSKIQETIRAFVIKGGEHSLLAGKSFFFNSFFLLPSYPVLAHFNPYLLSSFIQELFFLNICAFCSLRLSAWFAQYLPLLYYHFTEQFRIKTFCFHLKIWTVCPRIWTKRGSLHHILWSSRVCWRPQVWEWKSKLTDPQWRYFRYPVVLGTFFNFCDGTTDF